MPKSNKNKVRFGLFYVSHGNWVGPYGGKTFTEYSLNRRPISSDLKWIKNYVLKSRCKIEAVDV